MVGWTDSDLPLRERHVAEGRWRLGKGWAIILPPTPKTVQTYASAFAPSFRMRREAFMRHQCATR